MADEALDPALTAVTSTRVSWEAVPNGVRRSVEERLGDRVERSESQHRGFSPALASRLLLRSGNRVFVKAIAPDGESGAPGGQDFYRQEIRVAKLLPEGVAAPRLIAGWETEGWVVLMFEDVDGRHPSLPWDPEELASVLDAMSGLSDMLTPAPVPAPPAGVPGGPDHWRDLARDPARVAGLAGMGPWIVSNLGLLTELSAAAGPAFTGETLLHSDIRADNILLTDDRVVFVDWPHARIGAPWVDLAFFLPSVAMQGGPAPDDLFWGHPTARAAGREPVLSVLAALAGFFVHGATQPPPRGLPTLRAFQLAQGAEVIGWIRRILG